MQKTKRFRNFMDYQRNWLEETGSDDSHGRALWALGTVLGCSNTPTLQNMAGRMFEKSLMAILDNNKSACMGFCFTGYSQNLGRFAGDRRAEQCKEQLAGKLLELYQDQP